jgi:hypothetical protein
MMTTEQKEAYESGYLAGFHKCSIRFGYRNRAIYYKGIK